MANLGTTTITHVEPAQGGMAGQVRAVNIVWTCATGAATWEYDALGLYGTIVGIFAKPGATGTTDNSDLAIYHTGTTGANVLGTNGDNIIDNTTHNMVTITVPVPVCGYYDLVISNNAVNDATGTIILYLRA